MGSTRRLGIIVAGVSGVLLVPILSIPDWFGLEYGGQVVAVPSEVTGDAWASYGFTDVVLLISALAAIVLAAIGVVLLATDRGLAALPTAASAIVTALGVASVVLIVISIISPPDVGSAVAVSGPGIENSRKIGVWLGLLTSIGVAVGGYMTMVEEAASPGDEPTHSAGRMGPQ
jgi:hypothetical protein